jgi:SAM-dependent methyltransferase
MTMLLIVLVASCGALIIDRLGAMPGRLLLHHNLSSQMQAGQQTQQVAPGSLTFVLAALLAIVLYALRQQASAVVTFFPSNSTCCLFCAAGATAGAAVVLVPPQVMDALQMQFPDDSFDLVWACESGEHMPDKKAYVEEMTRVLAPGGNVSISSSSSHNRSVVSTIIQSVGLLQCSQHHNSNQDWSFARIYCFSCGCWR